MTDKVSELLDQYGAAGVETRELFRYATRVEIPPGLGLREFCGLSLTALDGVPGMNRVRRRRVQAIVELARRLATETLVRGERFESATRVFQHFHARMRDLKVEQFLALLLDGKHRVIREVLVSQGTLTSSPVHPREVFSAAIQHSAAAIVLVHNHPSGDPSPSADDIEITRRLCGVGELVGIRVLDHIIIGDGAFTSFKDRGLM